MSRMTIGKRLTASFGVLLVVALALAGSAAYWTGKLGHEFNEKVGVTSRKVGLIEEIQAGLFRMRSCQRGVMLFAMHNLADKVRSNQEEFEGRGRGVQQSLLELKPLLVTQEGRRLESEMEHQLPVFEGYFERVAAASMAGKHSDALQEYTEHSVKVLDALEKDAAEMMTLQKHLMADSQNTVSQDISSGRWMAAILAAVALLVAPFVFVAIRRITEQLRRAATELANGSGQIAGAASQVAFSSQSLAQGASEQAASLEETSASTEEITSMTRKNAENSRLAAETMAAVDRHVQDGNRTLEQMVVSMHEINAASDKIAKIIKVIDEIAFQTNILALNAAVEAARAGEAGMGFAVVADEVRNLAQRSAQAAKDTAGMIEESIEKSNEGRSRLEQVTEVIRAVTESAAKVKTLVDEVNLGSQEQARGIEQISKAVAQMDRVTQTTAANAEESASASQELSAQAEAMNHVVSQLRALVDGDAGGPPAPSTARGHQPPRAVAAPRTTSPSPAAALAPAGNSFPLEDDFKEL